MLFVLTRNINKDKDNLILNFKFEIFNQKNEFLPADRQVKCLNF